MPTPSSGAKPTVLRCSRCGKFVDWENARLQIVCGCRPRLDLPEVLVRAGTEDDRPAVLTLFERDFGRTRLVTFGEELHLETMSTVVADSEGEIAGALAYRERQEALHIVALATDPLWQRSGVGGHLLAEAELIARQRELGAGAGGHHQRQSAIAVFLPAEGLSHHRDPAGDDGRGQGQGAVDRLWRHSNPRRDSPDQGPLT